MRSEQHCTAAVLAHITRIGTDHVILIHNAALLDSPSPLLSSLKSCCGYWCWCWCWCCHNTVRELVPILPPPISVDIINLRSILLVVGKAENHLYDHLYTSGQLVCHLKWSVKSKSSLLAALCCPDSDCPLLTVQTNTGHWLLLCRGRGDSQDGAWQLL